MNAATDKPGLVYWRMKGGTLLTSVFGPPELVELALANDRQGSCANRAVLRRHIPLGAEAWARSEHGPWRPVSEFPKAWLKGGD